MRALFVDTGAFYAVADTSDEHHEAAKDTFVSSAKRDALVTSDFVVVETWLLIRARLGRPAAMRFWDAIGRGPVKVLGVGSADLGRGRDIANEWADQDFSVIDCTSFALMERAGITRAFAFDGHFRLYRFGERRRRAFEVLPAR